MQRITIERYRHTPDQADCIIQEHGQEPRVVCIADEFAGLIEGIRDDGTRWVMYIDAQGSPLIFWGEREEDGAVMGHGIPLQPDLRTSVNMDGTVDIEKVTNI